MLELYHMCNLMASINLCVFFFNDTATTEFHTSLHTLSLHDALPIFVDDRFDRPARDQRGDLAQLIAIRAHEEERVIHAAGPGFAANGRAHEPQHDAQNEEIGRAHV